MTSKRKHANRAALFFLVFFISCGGILVYRSGISEDRLLIYEGVLQKADIQPLLGNYGRSYGIFLDFDGASQHFGIYAGTKQQATSKFLSFDLVPERTYKLFIHPTVGRSLGGRNLGIRKITSNGKIIYKESMTAHMAFGLAFILLGLLSSTFFYLNRKAKI